MTQSNEERLMILQMVAEKKISAAEGAELLKALDNVEATAGQNSQTTHTIPPTPPTPPTPPAPEESTFASLIERLVDKFSFDFGDSGRVVFEEVHEGEFTAQVPELRLKTGNGKLHINGWEQPGYKVVLQYKVRGARDEEEARQKAKSSIPFEATGEGIALDGRRWDGKIGVSVELWLPKDRTYKLDGATGNGSLQLTNAGLTEGRLSSGNGSIKVDNVTADLLKTTTGNGAIKVIADVADYHGTTGNGSLKVTPTGARPQSLHVGTGNGSVRVSMNQISGATGYRVEGSTGMGSVNMNLTDIVLEKNVRTVGHKHVILRSQNYETAEARIDVKASTGLGSITIE